MKKIISIVLAMLILVSVVGTMSATADEYFSINDVSNAENWQAGNYNWSAPGDIVANSNRVCVSKKVVVSFGTQYTLDVGNTTAGFTYLLREFSATGTWVKSVSGLVMSGGKCSYTPSSANVGTLGVSLYHTSDTTTSILNLIQNGTLKPTMTAAGVATTTTEPAMPSMGNEYSPCTLAGGWASNGLATPTYLNGGKILRTAAEVANDKAAQYATEVKNFETLYNTAVAEGYTEISFDMYVYITSGSGTTIKAASTNGTLNDDTSIVYYKKGDGVVTMSFPLSTWVPEGKTAKNVASMQVWAMSYTYKAYNGAVYMSAPYIKNYTPKTSFTVTVDGNETKVNEGEEFTFPALNTNGVAFTDGTNYYTEGDKVTVDKALTFTTVDLGLSMQSGAAMRYNEVSGIRFTTNIDTTLVETLRAKGIEIALGTLIAPTNLLDGAALTFDIEAGKKVDVKFGSTNWYIDSSNEFKGIAGSLASVKDANAKRDFVGRGYATVTINGKAKTVYASYAANDISNNTRSIGWIASQIKAGSEYNTLLQAQKDVVDHYYNLYIA